MMRRQLKETRLAVNELLQKQYEDSQFLDMKTLLRVAQRSNQTTRDQLEQVRSELVGKIQSHNDRIHTMEIGFAELNDWAAKIADKANPEELLSLGTMNLATTPTIRGVLAHSGRRSHV